MPDPPNIDPKGATLADMSRAAGVAAQTLGGSGPRKGVSTSLVGPSFAHFRIDATLGAGGMGEVYLATDMALDRQVALKLRFLVMAAPFYLQWGIGLLFAHTAVELVALATGVVWNVAMFILIWRDPERRALWDRAAKTRVVYRRQG